MFDSITTDFYQYDHPIWMFNRDHRTAKSFVKIKSNNFKSNFKRISNKNNAKFLLNKIYCSCPVQTNKSDINFNKSQLSSISSQSVCDKSVVISRQISKITTPSWDYVDTISTNFSINQSESVSRNSTIISSKPNKSKCNQFRFRHLISFKSSDYLLFGLILLIFLNVRRVNGRAMSNDISENGSHSETKLKKWLDIFVGVARVANSSTDESVRKFIHHEFNEQNDQQFHEEWENKKIDNLIPEELKISKSMNEYVELGQNMNDDKMKEFTLKMTKLFHQLQLTVNYIVQQRNDSQSADLREMTSQIYNVFKELGKILFEFKSFNNELENMEFDDIEIVKVNADDPLNQYLVLRECRTEIDLLLQALTTILDNFPDN